MSDCGTHAGYYRHKRGKEAPCDPCVRAYRRHVKAWKVERDRSGPRIIPGDEVRAHVRRLLDNGMSLRSIGKFSGVSASTISNVMTRPGAGINRRSAARILAVDAPHYDHDPESETFVPRVGAERRIKALLAIGWTHAAMRAESGVTTHVLIAQRGEWVTQRNHNRIKDMYERLSMIPGPSAATRARAVKWGYPPPLAWDDADIDDPAAWAYPDLDSAYVDTIPDPVVVERLRDRPETWRAIGATKAERIEAAKLLGSSYWSALGLNGREFKQAAA